MSHFPAVKLIDETGAAQGVPFYGGSPSTVSQDYLLSLAEGDIPNHAPFAQLGYCAAGGTTENSLWPPSTPYVFPTAAQQMQVLSSAAADAAAGTGLRTLRIFYLDALYAPKTVDVTLNGTTPVNTSVSDIFRINRVKMLTAGSGWKAAGNISVRNTAGTVTYGYILAGHTRSRSLIFTVPAGKTLYVTSVSVGVNKSNAGNNALFVLRATYDDELGQLTAGLHFVPSGEFNLMDQYAVRPMEMPIKFPATTDVKMDVTAGQSSSICSATIRGWME